MAIVLSLLSCISITIRITINVIEAHSEVTAVGERVDRI